MQNLLSDFECEDSLKAFFISLSRYVAKSPDLLLLLCTVKDTDDLKFSNLYADLQSPDVLDTFRRNVETAANEYDWGNIENTYHTWGKYGWITEAQLMPLTKWDICPSS